MELSTVREVAGAFFAFKLSLVLFLATLGYKPCIALCSFFESVLKLVSLNDIQNLSADFRTLDAFDLAVFATIFLPAEQLHTTLRNCCNMVEF